MPDIKNIFPTKIIVRDNVLEQEDLFALKVATQAIFADHVAQTGSHVVSGEDSMPLFTPENMKIFPVLKRIRSAFFKGFFDLASEFDNNEMSASDISMFMDNHAGRLPIMKEFDYKGIHAHPGASAFGVFYLTDVNNDRDGGKLVLRDPSWHTNLGFGVKQKYPISTVSNRLIIAPAQVWHEVTPYSGKQDRLTIVSNLVTVSEELMK